MGYVVFILAVFILKNWVGFLLLPVIAILSIPISCLFAKGSRAAKISGAVYGGITSAGVDFLLIVLTVWIFHANAFYLLLISAGLTVFSVRKVMNARYVIPTTLCVVSLLTYLVLLR